MRPVNRGDRPTRTTTTGRTSQLNPQDYPFYMNALIQRLGEYCSYCEMPLGANLTLEHVLPKATFPNLEVDWDNFLLACANCNSKKGQNPKDGRTGYAWPDVDDTWALLTYYYDTDRQLCLVRPRTGLSTAQQSRIEATIELLKLNFHDPDDQTTQSDRRIWNRTRVWHRATTMVNLLAPYYTTRSTDISTVGLALLKRQVSDAVIASGFWSVWVTVFAQANFGEDAVRNQLLTDLFVTPFPGTRSVSP